MIAGRVRDLSLSGTIRWSCQNTNREFDGERFQPYMPACRIDNSDLGYDADFVDFAHLEIFFPSCWNGEDLDSADHESHIAYPERHPDAPAVQGLFCPGELTADPNDDWVRLPRISYRINFPVTYKTAVPEIDDNGRVIRDGSGNIILGSQAWLLSSDSYRTYGTLHDSSAPNDGEVLRGGISAHGDWFMAWDEEVLETWTQNCINEQRHCANGELGNGWRLTNHHPDRVLELGENEPVIHNRGNGGLTGNKIHHH